MSATPPPDASSRQSLFKLRQTPPDQRLRHIQGIRALCLLYVLLFHFEIGAADSGYLGVDMFFVISGFVMTRSICKSLFRDSFSLPSFFQSRYWRLCPALFVTCLLTLAFFYVIWEPWQFAAVQSAAVYSVFGLKNIQEMFAEQDYFSDHSKAKPLLHVWSLSLEQQFYAIYAIALKVVHRAAKKSSYAASYYPAFVAGTSLLFMSLGLLLSKHYPLSSFYFIFQRFYEFGFGCMLFFLRDRHPREQNVKGTVRSDIAVIVALIVPTAQVFNLTPDHFTLRSRLWSLISTCLLIDFSDSRISSLLLGNDIAVGIGEASYSVYLLHLPIWTWFSSVYSCSESKSLLIPSVLVTLVVASVLVFVLVEKPFRTKKGSYIPGFSLFTLMFFTVLLAKTIHMKRTAPFNFRIQKAGDFQFHIPEGDSLFPTLGRVRRMDWVSQQIYENGRKSESKNVSNTYAMLIGNSFAFQIADGFRLASGRLKKKMVMYTIFDCRFDIPKLNSLRPCEPTNELIWQAVMRARPKVVFIGHRWERFFKTAKMNEKSRLPDKMIRHYREISWNFTAYGIKTVFTGTTPANDKFREFARCQHLLKTPLRSLVTNADVTSDHYSPRQFFRKANVLMKRYFNSTERPKNTYFLDVFGIFCENSGKKCKFEIPTDTLVPDLARLQKTRFGLWADGVHLSIWGSWAVGQKLDQFLK